MAKRKVHHTGELTGELVERLTDEGSEGSEVDVDAWLAAKVTAAALVDLQGLYDDFNRLYFAGALPRYTVVRDDSVLRQQEESHAATFAAQRHMQRHPGETFAIDGSCDDFDRRITINSHVAGDALKYLLLHEMCHVQQPGRGGHGPIFKARAREVARQAGVPLVWILFGPRP